jgi:hypothetical protein
MFKSRTCNGMKQELASLGEVFASHANFAARRITSLRHRRREGSFAGKPGKSAESGGL